MTLMLIDSASLWYRAYYGMPDTLLAPDGTPVNAIKGFLDMSARLIQKYQPNRLIACLDGDWRPSWRVELFPEYKANRIAADGEEEEPSGYIASDSISAGRHVGISSVRPRR
jgi:5'-3' exonuclease